MTPIRSISKGGPVLLALLTTVSAQEKPFTQPGTGQPPAPPQVTAPAASTPAGATAPPKEPGAVETFFNGKLPAAIAQGKFNLNARVRYEFVDQSNLPEDSNALTLRTRFGFTTAPLYGFQGMIEGENITAVAPEHNYNAAGSNNEPDRPVVADAPTTELNQAWLGYAWTNLASARLGRQRLVLDNHRFVGDVGWRQNMQTFDAVTAQTTPLADLNLFYGYLWEVNRVYGDVDGLPPTSANKDFESNSHLVNVSYTPCRFGRLVVYTYLLDLDLDNGTATQNNNSCATYGGYFAGSAPLSEKLSLGYRAEFAWQTDYADSSLDYSTEYYNLELSGNLKPFAFGAGYEVLGSDDNVGFKTPLATGHAFNGWADVFLNTPADGLRDVYVFAQVTLPQQIPLRIVYHNFEADQGGGNLGQEVDLIASRKFGKHWSGLLKYAYYDGKSDPAAYNVHKFWAQAEFNF